MSHRGLLSRHPFRSTRNRVNGGVAESDMLRVVCCRVKRDNTAKIGQFSRGAGSGRLEGFYLNAINGG